MGISCVRGEKDNFMQGEIQPSEVRLNMGKLGKLES